VADPSLIGLACPPTFVKRRDLGFSGTNMTPPSFPGLHSVSAAESDTEILAFLFFFFLGVGPRRDFLLFFAQGPLSTSIPPPIITTYLPPPSSFPTSSFCWVFPFQLVASPPQMRVARGGLVPFPFFLLSLRFSVSSLSKSYVVQYDFPGGSARRIPSHFSPWTPFPFSRNFMFGHGNDPLSQASIFTSNSSLPIPVFSPPSPS